MHRGVVACLSLVLFAGVACGGSDGGGDDGSDDPDRPLDLAETTFGVTFHHGEAGILDNGEQPDQSVIDRSLSVSGAGFLDLQSYDEHSWQFGEWEVHPRKSSDSDYRSPGMFRNNPGMARFENRADDLVEEVESRFGEFRNGGFDELGMILDVWRMRGDWYVRWDGTLDAEENRIGRGDYGFYRSDMREDIASQVVSAAGVHQPEYLVVGSDMERLLGRRGEPGLAPDEFSNFRQFYNDVVEGVSDSSPSTRMGIGFDWDRFARHVAPRFGDGETGEVPPRETLRRAFESVVLPSARAGGLVALKTYREPSGEMEHYRFLADLDEMFDMEGISVIWYSVGSPVESSVAYRQQRTFLEEFIEANRGVEPELVVWRSLLNFDGVDLAGQGIDGRCKAMVEEEFFQLDRSHCFDGLFNAVFEPKGLFDFVAEETGGG